MKKLFFKLLTFLGIPSKIIDPEKIEDEVKFLEKWNIQRCRFVYGSRGYLYPTQYQNMYFWTKNGRLIKLKDPAKWLASNLGYYLKKRGGTVKEPLRADSCCPLLIEVAAAWIAVGIIGILFSWIMEAL